MFYQYLAIVIAGSIIFSIIGVNDLHINNIFSSFKLTTLILFLGLITSGISYLIQLYSFKRIGVENSSMILNIMPIVSYIFAIILLGEHFNTTKTIIVLTIVIALYLFTKFESKQKL